MRTIEYLFLGYMIGATGYGLVAIMYSLITGKTLPYAIHHWIFH